MIEKLLLLSPKYAHVNGVLRGEGAVKQRRMRHNLRHLVISIALTISALCAGSHVFAQPIDFGDLRYRPVRAGQPFLGVKTNLLYLATTSPNAIVEFSLAKKWTFNTAIGFNAWDFDPARNDEISLRHWLVQPELRYWFCQAFEGHLVGVHGIYSQFDAGNIPYIKGEIQDYIYRGFAYGGGVSWGYHFPLAKRWGLEVTAGFGFLILDYDKYNCLDCLEYLGSFKRNYVGPTKLGVSLVLMIQ